MQGNEQIMAALERGLASGCSSKALACALTSEALLAASDAAILANPQLRARLEQDRKRPDPELSTARWRDAAPTSFGAAWAGFMAHYGLSPGFFPGLELLANDERPTAWAARRISQTHDFLHVLGAYETSDLDELRVQSFTLGQAPVPWALFMSRALFDDEVAALRYRHLRDVGELAPARADVERGRAARPLLAERLEDRLGESLASVREQLGVAPRHDRPPREAMRWTCAVTLAERPYFE